MPRRRRSGKKSPSARAAPPEPEGRLRAPLVALFPDGLPVPPPPPPPPPPEPRLVSEHELMARAFAALAGGAALDFDAIRVVTRLPAASCPKKHVLADMPAAGTSRTPARADAPGRNSPDGLARLPTSPAVAGRADPAGAATGPGRDLAVLQARTWAGTGWRDEPGRTHEHARAVAELVARARRGRLPTLRLRGLRREPALEALAAFVARERAARSRYVRIVTGKGLGSPGDPVLKEALAEWCASTAGEAEVTAWAPELDVRGEYGSVILQLRPWG
ncbi:Smr/MutS family protein [Nannocystis sp. SCPEA4]|uniref:Smr/MutS family protein n=1 Tax=Nannocystis sp. SCPEA4 TaxID=2996787 RepID=UPI002270F52C|nr:Smr/MutS family protein [Nannocystis sp. SCPEA4]MCY1053786.1 Smr/MutS family protein [Nannocystis sp. SCPEA4]